MASWVLIIALGGYVGNVSDVKMQPMTELQCKQAVRQLMPLKKYLSVTCVGPEGGHFGFDDMKVND